MEPKDRIRAKARVLTVCFMVTAAGAATPFMSALAQTASLSQDQLAAIATDVNTALADIDPTLTGAARNQAIAQALSQVTTTEISRDGAGAIGPIIAAAIAAGIAVPQAVAPVLPAATAAGIAPAATINA